MARRELLNPAAEILNVTPHWLRIEAKAGRMPHLKCGNRYIFDIELCEKFLTDKALENMKIEEKNESKYGVLRKVECKKGIERKWLNVNSRIS